MKIQNNNRVTHIISEMKKLLGELESHLSSEAKVGDIKIYSPKSSLSYSGASGGVLMLIENGYFKEPKSLVEVSMSLRQEGYIYPRNAIAMALLRAVRSRFLVRLPTEGPKSKEKWIYVIRK